MENELNAMMVASLYLGLAITIFFLGWGLYSFGTWMEEKIQARYLAKTRNYGKISIYYHN